MKFRVHGAKRSDGTDASEIVEARDEAGAAALVLETILIERIEPIPDVAAPATAPRFCTSCRDETKSTLEFNGHRVCAACYNRLTAAATPAGKGGPDSPWAAVWMVLGGLCFVGGLVAAMFGNGESYHDENAMGAGANALVRLPGLGWVSGLLMMILSTLIDISHELRK